MRWLHRTQAVSPAAGRSHTEFTEKDKDPTVHDSPALTEILASLDPDRPVRVLDLGSALQTNLDFYANIANGVRIVPLQRNDGLEGLQQLDAKGFSSRLDRLLPIGDETFGLVLMWDLLNYLVDEQPSLLAHHLAAITEHGASIHVMIVTTETMPTEPSRYELLDGGRLAYRPTTRSRTTAPDPPPAMVERWLDPFRVERSFLLRHGVREFIAVNAWSSSVP